MEKYKCLIVDDEPAAHFVLSSYVERTEGLELAWQCYNAIDALEFLKTTPVDLVFLDINMPEMTGFEMLKTVQDPPKIIVTTAYSEFALESYEYWVIDYLLKPIEYPRFLKAIDRFIAAQDTPSHPHLYDIHAVKQDFISVKVDHDQVKIQHADFLYAQSFGNYVKIITTNQTLLASITTTELEHMLPAARFMRIHKSHIVALDKIESQGNGFVVVGGIEFPVGITYRRELAERLK